METQEIRIVENGYYYWQGVIIKIDRETLTKYNKGFKSYDDLQPIPLTEEILLKCGFEYELGYGYRNKSITGLMLKSIGTSDYNVFTYCGITIEIPSLHQLQKLFFALTGEELEINL